MKKLVLLFVLLLTVLAVSANNKSKKSIYASGKSLEIFQTTKQLSDTIYAVKIIKTENDFRIVKINKTKLDKQTSQKVTNFVKKNIKK